jgi:hypothetical protein
MGGHVAAIRRIEDLAGIDRLKTVAWHDRAPWPGAPLERARIAG